MCQDERIKEACGVFGIYNPHGEDAASSIYYGLSSLQHRGQESCGIAVFDTSGPKGNMNVQRGMGLVSEVFTPENLDKLHGDDPHAAPVEVARHHADRDAFADVGIDSGDEIDAHVTASFPPQGRSDDRSAVLFRSEAGSSRYMLR